MRCPDRTWSSEATLRYWIGERHAIYLRRRSGAPPPWTEDRVLRSFRFTNVSRRFDKMTQVLRRDLAGADAPRQLLTVVAYRMFNRLSAWELLRDPVRRGWSTPRVRCALRAAARRGERLTSGVWMVGGTAGRAVWETQLLAADHVANHAPGILVGMASLAAAFAGCCGIPWVGPFVANEMVMDLLYEARLLRRAPDRSSWVRLGPGATRGIRRFRGKADPGWQPPDADRDDYEALRRLHAALMRRPVRGAPALTLHDVEHCLCEYDKYARATFEDARLKNVFRAAA